MADAASAIVALLKGASAVTALIGTGDAARIAAAGLPAGSDRPNIAHQTVSDRRTYSNDGPSGLARSTVQVSCYADDYATAKQLAAAARVALNGYAGTAGGTEVQSILVSDMRDAPQAPPPGQTRGVPGVILILSVAYND